MDTNNRIDIDIHGESQRECCNKLVSDFMIRNAEKIALRVVDLGITESKQFEFLCGFMDGYAMAMESILSGAINLQEIVKEYPGQEQEGEQQ